MSLSKVSQLDPFFFHTTKNLIEKLLTKKETILKY